MPNSTGAVREAFCYQQAYAATNMREIVALAHQYEIPLSHDDTTEENVADAIRGSCFGGGVPDHDGSRPRLHQAGIGILMGRRTSCAVFSFRQHRRGRSRPRGVFGYPVVRLHPLEPADGGGAAIAATRSHIDLAAAVAPSPRRQPKLWALPTAAKRDRQARRSDPGARRRDIPVVRSVWREGRRVA